MLQEQKVLDMYSLRPPTKLTWELKAQREAKSARTGAFVQFFLKYENAVSSFSE